MNRRLYREGRYYQLKIDADPDLAGDIEVYTLRDDWAVQKAYQMAYSQYLENTQEERQRLGDQQVARWEDFRVESGVESITDDVRAQYYNVSLGTDPLTAGEFELSRVVDGAGTERLFTWGSGTATRYSMLAEYDSHGNAQGSPNSAPSAGAYEDLTTEIDATTYDNLQADGNLPPYNQTSVDAQSPFTLVGVLQAGAAGVQKLSTGYFTAPCGFVILKGVGAAEDDKLCFEVKAGDYKGVHAPTMLDTFKERSGFGSMGTWRNGVWTKD
jgi:hypothetical protein